MHFVKNKVSMINTLNVIRIKWRSNWMSIVVVKHPVPTTHLLDENISIVIRSPIDFRDGKCVCCCCCFFLWFYVFHEWYGCNCNTAFHISCIVLSIYFSHKSNTTNYLPFNRNLHTFLRKNHSALFLFCHAMALCNNAVGARLRQNDQEKESERAREGDRAVKTGANMRIVFMHLKLYRGCTKTSMASSSTSSMWNAFIGLPWTLLASSVWIFSSCMETSFPFVENWYKTFFSSLLLLF